VVAGEREIPRGVAAAVLAGDDVINVKTEKWFSLLRESAVFAAVRGSLLH
jgi:hypothetical protein